MDENGSSSFTIINNFMRHVFASLSQGFVPLLFCGLCVYVIHRSLSHGAVHFCSDFECGFQGWGIFLSNMLLNKLVHNFFLINYTISLNQKIFFDIIEGVQKYYGAPIYPPPHFITL